MTARSFPPKLSSAEYQALLDFDADWTPCAFQDRLVLALAARGLLVTERAFDPARDYAMTATGRYRLSRRGVVMRQRYAADVARREVAL